MHTTLLTTRHALGAMAMSLALLASARPLAAAQTVGGSLELSSDYLVRGISRTSHGAAVQADLHVASDAGWLAGVFASNIRFDSGDERSAELDAFAGYAWQAGDAWRTKLVAAYYGYAGNSAGSQYNYAEASVEAAYAGWLDLDLIYSPNSPRYLPYRGVAGVSDTSVEANMHTPWHHRLAAAAGIGASRLGGPGGGTYAYWSAGGALDLAPLSISLNYVSTSAEAAALYYGAAAHNRWVATMLWRF